MRGQTANYDEPWKEALTEYFEAFLRFFFLLPNFKVTLLEDGKVEFWESAINAIR